METGSSRPLLEIVDRSFDNADPKICHMSILLQEGGLSFCLIRKDLKKIILLGYHPCVNHEEGIKELRSQITADFGSYSLSIQNPNYTLMPKALSGDANKAMLGALLQEESPAVEEIEGTEILLGFPKAADLHQNINHTFSGAKILPQSYYSISYLLQQSKYKPGIVVFVLWENDLVEIGVAEGEKLLLHNTYEANTIEDAGYYVLAVYDQLAINPLETGVFVGGFAVNDSFVDFLKKYIKEIFWLDEYADIQFSHEISKQQVRQFAPIMIQLSCVL